METRSFRNRSAVGRFPSVTLSLGDDGEEDQEEPEEQGEQTENACRRWLQKVCPCCCRRRSKDDDDDVTEVLETLDEVEDNDADGDKDKDKETGEEKPPGNEVNGKDRRDKTRLGSEVAANTSCAFLQSSSSEWNPST